MAKRPALASADARPRIYVRPLTGGWCFSHSADGRQHFAESIGAAVENAVAAIGGRDAVIIFKQEK